VGLFGKGKPKPEEKKFSERSPRVRLLLSDAASLETAEGPLPLQNISETGAAFAGQRVKGESLRGTLRIGTESIAVELFVTRSGENSFGAHFVKGGAEVRSALRRLFTDELRATEMSEVAGDHLKAPAEPGRPRWFYAPGNYELFFLEDGGKVRRLELEWKGAILAYASDQPLRQGMLDAEDREKPAHARAALVKWLPEVDPAARAKAVRIVENIPGLDAELKRQISALLEG
jgi:hypothetical protein